MCYDANFLFEFCRRQLFHSLPVTHYSLLITLSVVASVDKQKKKIFSKIASIRTDKPYLQSQIF